MSEFPSVKRPQDELEPQEVILQSFRGQQLEIPLSKKALLAVYACFTLFALFMLGRAFQMQVFLKGQFTALAQNNVARQIPMLPERGVIYDKNFTQLTFNAPSFDFVCDKRDMSSLQTAREDMFKEISGLLLLDVDALREQFSSAKDPLVLVKPDLSQEELVTLKAKNQDFEGCQVQENARRSYPQGEIFSQLLGYTGKVSKDEQESAPGYSVIDQIGKSGVEKSYESILRGTPGITVVQKDASGKVVSTFEQSQPKQGGNLLLWLDAELQKKLTQSLLQSLRQTGAKKAAAVALDPTTGGVLAMVSLPSFDNNMFSQGLTSKEWQDLANNSSHPLFNRAISGNGYPTGSVIKPFIASAALQEGVITGRTSIFAPSEICVDNKFTKEQECFHDWTFHGTTDVKRAIAESVNPFFYIVGGGYQGFQGLGANRIEHYLQLFGWGKETGLDLPSEGNGTLPAIDNNWRLGDTYHLAIGQGAFAVTPLQVADAMSAIANGGKLLQPQVAQKIVDAKKNTVKEFIPQVARENFIDAKNLDIVRQGMRQAITAGSATGWLDRLPVSAAAKTGTAQTGRKTQDGRDYLYSWIATFAPYANPKIVLVVVVEDVREGEVATLPVARDVLQWYFGK